MQNDTWSSRAQGWRAGALVLMIAGAVGAGDVAAQLPGSSEETVRRAVENAVLERFGPSAAVTGLALTAVRMPESSTAIQAVPDHRAAVGRPARFALSTLVDGRPRRVGEATVIVSVTADTVRARRTLTRGEVLQPADLDMVRADLDGTRFTALASPDVAIGARTTRGIPAGTALTLRDIVQEPDVRAGDQVRASVRVSGVEIVATAVATQTGARHDVITVMNPGSRRVLRGRVTGPGEVEVLDVR